MPRRPQFTTKQALLRLSNIGPGGMIDLTSLDLTSIDMANQELRDGFRKFASFHRENSAKYGMPYINLTGSDISGLDFSNIDLSNVIFSGVTAIGTIFAGSVMSDTQFDHACADEADFSRADLYHTKFYMTTIRGANFTEAKMKFTHGLGGPQEAVMRLGVTASIKDAMLPPGLDPLRAEIEKAIRMHMKKSKGERRGFSLTRPKDEKPSIIPHKKPGASNPDDSGFSDI
jgi:uncharacterized protein YjbI with pentapeptide repeats